VQHGLSQGSEAIDDDRRRDNADEGHAPPRTLAADRRTPVAPNARSVASILLPAEQSDLLNAGVSQPDASHENTNKGSSSLTAAPIPCARTTAGTSAAAGLHGAGSLQSIQAGSTAVSIEQDLNGAHKVVGEMDGHGTADQTHQPYSFVASRNSSVTRTNATQSSRPELLPNTVATRDGAWSTAASSNLTVGHTSQADIPDGDGALSLGSPSGGWESLKDTMTKLMKAKVDSAKRTLEEGDARHRTVKKGGRLSA
jgi:hypothetical protein